MRTMGTREDIGSGNNQLSLNFNRNSPDSQRAGIADRIHAITSGNISFHPEKSVI